MYTNGSEEFNRLIETPNNKAIQKRLVFEDTGMVIDKFKTLIMYSSSNNQELQIGTTNMSYLDVEAFTDIAIFDGQKLRLECGVELSDGSMEYAPMGVFTAVNTEKGLNSVKFTANDNMQKTEKLYTSSLTYPTTSDKIISEICEICEIELATPIENPITVVEKLQGYTCREVLGFIAGIHGKFACFDRLGQLNLRWYSEMPIEKQNSLIWSFTKSQEPFIVDKIEIAKNTETKFTSGEGNNTIYHSNPLATQQITDNILDDLRGFSYSTSNIEMLDDIRLDIWDVIKVTYLDGNEYFIPCMSIKQNMGASSTYIESFSKSKTQNQYRYEGPTAQFINRMATELLITNRIVASKVDADYVQSHAITTDNLEAIKADIKYAVIEDLDADFITTEELEAESAVIKVAVVQELSAEFGDIKQLKSDVAKIDTLIFGTASGDVIQTTFANSVIAQLGDAQIKSAMIQDVSASKITAGTIYTNDVTIQSKNGQMMLKDNTIQISDGTRARVQIGKDASNDYSINVWDKSGNLMFSQGGITDKAIKSAIIRNDMVSENANIHAGKLDISSLFTEINDNTTRSIKATKIYIDEKGQSLEFAFKQMTTTVDNITQTQTSQGTQLEIINGQISSKIWQQDITSAIDNVDIGGRNLLLNTKEFSKTTTQNQTGIALDIGKFTDYYMITRATGKKIAISFDWETTATSGTFRLTFNNTPWASIFPNSTITITPTNQKGRVEYIAALTEVAVDSSALYTALRLRIDNVDGTTIIKNVKCEYGNKSTDWTPAPEETEAEVTILTTKYSTLEQDISGFKTTVSETYSTKTETKTVETIATQTANKFNWIVKNGTSATDFTLTDRMAKLTADIISLNGNVKVNGDMLVTGAVTADKIAIGDFTNLAVINPDAYNPDNYTVAQDDNGVNWFEFGSDTTLGYYKINLNVLPSSTIFKKGDDFLFRGLLKANINTSVRICVRVVYVDKTYTNIASVYYDNVTTESKEIKIPFTINSVPESSKKIDRYIIFLETRNTQLGIIYARDLSVHQMTNNVLIADGTITADKINVADLFAQDIVATGSIISPLLKSTDYTYASGDYSNTGMLVDLKNKLIRTPKVAIKPDGSIVADDGIFKGKITATSGEISGNLAFGSSGSITHTNGDYSVTLKSVASNAGLGIFYITDRSSGTATYPFRVNGNGSVIATNITATGKLNASSGSTIGGENGWEITSNQIRSKNLGLTSANTNEPRLTISTGNSVEDTFILAPDCFLLGSWQDANKTKRLGARFVGNVEIHGSCDILGAATALNMAITGGSLNLGSGAFMVDANGNLTAGNANLTGGKIGDLTIQNGTLTGTGSGTKMALYPNGKSYNVNSSTADVFFLVVYNAGGVRPVGGITNTGWKNII